MLNHKETILVTGGAGYIGSHVVLELKRQGYQVIVIDNLVNGHRDIVENVLQTELWVGDIRDRLLLDGIFANYKIAAVMHFAAHAYVGESVTNPSKYYQNNVLGTLNLIEAMLAANIPYLVFSSTCATYGVPNSIPIQENHLQNPINPYGMSKLMVEKIISDYQVAYGLKSVIFRYFNAAGAEPTGLIGENHNPETHLIPLVLHAALGIRDSIKVFGTNYPTPDGTCVRDYIHVSDLAQAHIQGLEYIMKNNEPKVFNLGNGCGFSVKEVIDTAIKVTGKTINVIEAQRRSGDPHILIGSSEKAIKTLNWNPQYSDLSEIILHAWNWHQKIHRYQLSLPIL